MSLPPAAPFLRPDPARITAGPWTLTVRGEELLQPSHIEGWDYVTPISASRRVEVDVPRVLHDCQLSPGTTLAVAVRWRSTWTDRHGWTTPAPVVDGAAGTVVLLSAQELGGLLRLDTCLVLPTASTARGRLAPHRAGSILWTEPYAVLLEGEAARFPLELIEFSRAGIQGGTHGGWLLHWHPDDLDAAALGTIRLFLNAEHPLVARTASGDRADPLVAAVISAIYFDVARILVNGALDHEQFDDDSSWPDGSVGAVLRQLLHTLFPGRPVSSLRSQRELAGTEFDTLLQAATRLFHP